MGRWNALALLGGPRVSHTGSTSGSRQLTARPTSKTLPETQRPGTSDDASRAAIGNGVEGGLGAAGQVLGQAYTR